MSTIKKKDIKNYKKRSEEDIEELVDADGSPIEGDRNPVSNSEIETAPQQTSDDFADSAIQPNRRYYGYGGTPYSHGRRITGEGEDDLEGEELAEAKMKKMVEDILSQKSDSRDMVKKNGVSDINRNNIPDMEELAQIKPVVGKKVEDVLKTISMNNLTGEEIGVVINYLLTNIDLSEVPSDYKKLLKNSI
jgi:hypothetical protein